MSLEDEQFTDNLKKVEQSLRLYESYALTLPPELIEEVGQANVDKVLKNVLQLMFNLLVETDEYGNPDGSVTYILHNVDYQKN